MPEFIMAALQRAAIRIADDAALPVTFAGEQWQHYLQQMTGVYVPIVRDVSLGGRETVVLGEMDVQAMQPALLQGDGFRITPQSTCITVEAGSPRAVLNAVYTVLEQFGCRWSPHGPDDETVPRLSAPTLELHAVEHAPDFAARGYCSDIMTWHYTQPEYLNERLEDDRPFIDWMGKSGANTFFFIRHPFDTQLTIPELLPDFERRGIDLEYGGHVIPLLLPRELYREHPDYFPESPDGARTDHGNLCTSNAAALATACANAVQYVREYPEMCVVHLWGADLWHGGWCRCTACSAVSVQDQSLRMCNAVARGLAEAGLRRPVCYLAYHDTIEPDLTLPPDDNVIIEFAPRERCYGHALNDPECATNRRYAAALERYVDLFDGRVRLFEYYGDSILFFGCAVPLTQVIAADLDYYKRLGVPGITMLQFGTFSVWAYALNFVTFATKLMSACESVRVQGAVPARPVDSIDDYCARFGPHARTVRALLADLETVMRQVVTYGDIRRPPRDRAAAAVLLAQVDAALPRLLDLAHGLEQFRKELLNAQAALIRYTHQVLEGVRQELCDSVAGRPPQPETHYTEALQILEAVERRFKGLWGGVDLPMIHSFYRAVSGAQ